MDLASTPRAIFRVTAFKRPHGAAPATDRAQRWQWLLLSIAFAVMTPSALAQQKQPLVTLVSGANQTFLPKDLKSDSDFEVRIPVTVADGKKLNVRKLDVIYKDGRTEGLFKAFDVIPVDASAAEGAALLVTSKQTLWPGVYVVSLGIAASDTPKDEQSVVLNLTVPSPQVTATPKVVVSQLILPWPFGSSPFADTLEVRETSGKIAALELTPMEMHDAPAHGDAISASLKFGVPASGPSARLKAPAKFVVTPEGEFPLGTTTGHIDIVSPSISPSLSVPFEVRAHRSQLLILLVAALGTLLGWYVRVHLTQRQTLLDAKGAIAAATRTVLRARQTCQDPGFGASMLTLLQQLADAQETDDPKKMNDAAKAVEDEVKKQRDALEARVPAVSTKIQNVHKIADVQWSLPPSLSGAVSALRGPVSRATDLLSQRNLTDAEALIDTQIDDAIPALARGLVQFGQQLSKYLDAAASSPFPATGPNTQRLSDLAKESVSTAQEIASAVRTGSLEETTVALNKTHALFQEVKGFADAAVAMANNLCDFVRERLREAFGDIDARFAPVREASTAAAEQFAQGVLTPQTAIFGLGTESVRAAWKGMLLSLSPSVAQDTLQDALGHAQWQQAVELAIKAAAKAPDTHALDEQKAMSARTDLVTELTDSEGVTAAAATPATSLGTQLPIDPAKEIASQSKDRQAFIAQSRATAALQSFCFGALFVVGAYVAYGENWIGTAKEMLAVFVLAFGMDLTSDSVLSALKKPPSA